MRFSDYYGHYDLRDNLEESCPRKNGMQNFVLWIVKSD
jgi:hypothetical protein